MGTGEPTAGSRTPSTESLTMFLVVIGLMVGAWLLAVTCLAHYYGRPKALLGFGASIRKWFWK